MKIAVIGASAGVGLLTVQQALQRKHAVVALSRNTESLPQHKNLTIIKGNALDKDDLKKAVNGADAVIVTLGTGKSTKATTLYSKAAAALVRLEQESGTNIPFIILTGFGAGDSGKYQGFFMKIIFYLLLKAVYRDKTLMENIISESKIKWEIVRPGMLTDKPYTGKYRVETQYKKGMNIGQISRADVADFLIRQAESKTLLYKYPALSNK